MKKIVWLIALLSAFSYASVDVENMTDDDKAAYALGLAFGKHLLDSANSMTEVSESSVKLNNNQILQGLKDGLNNNALLTEDEIDVTLNALGERVNGSQDSESQFTDKMATYATIAGRAAACGIDMQKETEVVGKWMDREFDRLSLTNKMRSTYLMVFAEGMTHHMQEQLAGNSPDTCESIQGTLNGFPWPYI
ncbi:TPA: hypothetical protein I7139_23305 [Vibrio vulnificus]|nr:hypothetical protein [Vibrio vulnificus]